MLEHLKNEANRTYTENGAVTYATTYSDCLDLFATIGALRSSNEQEIISRFVRAFTEDPDLAMKTLFFARDVRGGLGERKVFRVCLQWLAHNAPASVKKNIPYVAEFGRWDDLYVFVGTALEKEAFAFMKEQLALDVTCKTPSLLAKWLKSENTSSQKSRELANKTRAAFGMNHKQYRKTLSVLRERINIVERLMSENRWDEIEFDKIPSRAGMIYKNAFARHDIERMKKNPEVKSYADFAKDTETKVNAKALYPYEVVDKATKVMRCSYWGGSYNTDMDGTDRLMVNKYWDNLTDYFNKSSFLV